ncbi:pilin [Patescibacteria group bacterium]|nr:pilin [Patescibacteria group bacterium]
MTMFLSRPTKSMVISAMILMLSGLFMMAPLSARATDCIIGAEEVFCSSCAVGNRCLTDNEERGTCQVVPEGTADQIISPSVTVRATNMICTTDGTTPAMMPATTTTDKDKDKKAAPPVEPRFSVNIPTVNLTSVQVGGSFIDIPWLADYLTGVYKYAVFFASILAAVMLMIGGIQWLTSAGDSGRVGVAQKRITNATIGLVLILGSYLVLSTINPDLVALKPLRIATVPPDPLEVELNSTTVPTSVSGDHTYQVLSNRGSYTAQYFNNCPITLPAGQPPSCEGRNTFALPTCRERLFFEGIAPLLQGDTSQRYVMAMEAAWKCDVEIGSCGRTLSDLAELALSGANADCLMQENRSRFPLGCMDAYQNRAQTTTLRGWSESLSRRNAQMPSQELIDLLQRENPGYPDNLNIRPGAIITYYNGNSSGGGSHRVWVGSYDPATGMAQLLEGQVHSPPRSRDICLSTTCGRFAPIGIISYLR